MARKATVYHINYGSDRARSAGDWACSTFHRAQREFYRLLRDHPEAEMALTEIVTSADGNRSTRRLAVFDPAVPGAFWFD